MAHLMTWEAGGLYRKFTGEISAPEIIKLKLALNADVRFRDIKYIINDFSEISEHSLMVEHAEALSRMNEVMSNTKHKLKIALVATDERLLYFAESYCAFMKNKVFECALFHNVEDARKWTDV